ncbi:cob(I)yrinic acid a,c-diamide adenosyltransferase [Flavobacteriaceae bacterium]|jgi:cob(I)alamin adenosyltransferase|nr:cob(I)yrinic acid a,c-diamide adenosyltransferase [Flavobacteriaceae bacterium]
MKTNKVYTKTGDSGVTSLISGKRVPKHDIRIKAYGTIDELIVWLGLIRDITTTTDIKATLLEIQKQLMTIAAELSVESEKELPKNLIPIQPNAVKHIENKIDILAAELPLLKNFVIPGGHVLISYAHLARCVCRRAERCVTELDEEVSVSSTIIAYMNRLSDYFFTLSRTFALELDVEEIKWERN